ncbi:MAG: 6-carboxytetrahydropterin synthase QueD [Deltaproteobacteria bacterium]|nr:6-carboxytetrahydropterin synthase QueD [Deltaproteobacteria bacterium]MBW2068255.1 6-carboxytetrahydropterin synthase QueD [Deltaproteobacteria bacterium]
MQEFYEVKIISDFAGAHRLRNFKGKCEELHGHNWKVEVVVRGTRLDESGVLIDFGELKEATREVLSKLDHKYLNDLPYFKEINPSSENIAKYIFEKLSKRFNSEKVQVYSVSAWESEKACATYFGKGAENAS